LHQKEQTHTVTTLAKAKQILLLNLLLLLLCN